jgi:hypothetical protein
MGRVRPGYGEASRTACARVLVRGETDEATCEALAPAVLTERMAWCSALVRGMAAGLVEGHWDAGDIGSLAAGRDAAGRPLPKMAWTAMRRLGWHAGPPGGVIVNDRVARMAQEQAGRLLRSACWRAALADAIITTWPTDPGKRTAEEWDAVRAAVPGAEHVLSSVIRARTRQVARFLAAHGRMPVGVFDLEPPPPAAGMLILAACDRQEATIERSEADPSRALLRL